MQSVVVASLQALPDGSVRLVLDDAVCDELAPADRWTKRALFTQVDLPAATDELTDAVLADIGLNLILRLRATNGLEA